MNFTELSTWGLLYYTSEWVIRLVMLVVVPFRRSPEAAKGWLLLILFFPWPGFLLYHVIGRPTFPAWRVARFRRLRDLLEPIEQRLDESLRRFRLHVPASEVPEANLVKNLGGLGMLGANSVEQLADYNSGIDRLVADIDEATDHVHLLYYLFADDAAGMKVITALSRAVQRGVVCRVLIDALGSKTWSRSVVSKMTTAGVHIHVVLPVSLFRPRSTRGDLRNHRKIAVFDGRVGYTGSQNIVDASFKAGIVYEELVVRVTGPIVLQLQAVFVSDWFLETEEKLNASRYFPEPIGTGSVMAQVLPSGPDFPAENVQRLVVSLIHNARQRVVMTTPYFIPDDSLLVALDTAVRRGVEVHVVVSQTADQLLVSLAQHSYYTQLLNSGVHLHLYGEKFLHAKHLSTDDSIAVIGSSNFDIRSFMLNSEVSLISYDRHVAARLREQQERYFAGSKRLTASEWRNRSGFTKVCENLARLFSPLL